MPFFTSTPKKPSPVFAGLDDPFNFPSAKMRYTTRPTTRPSSRTSSADSGYASIDDNDDAQLSPKSSAAPPHRQRLKKDERGHWRMHNYEYQSTGNDRVAERAPILTHHAASSSSSDRAPDNAHVFVPNPQRTFTLICDEGVPEKSKTRSEMDKKSTPKTDKKSTSRTDKKSTSKTHKKSASKTDKKSTSKTDKKSTSKHDKKSTSKTREKSASRQENEKEEEGWFERRVYGRALQRRERSEGVSELQRQMAPVLRRASPAPDGECEREHDHERERDIDLDLDLVHRRSSTSRQRRPPAGSRKGSTLLHPSAPPAGPSPGPSFGITTTIVGGVRGAADDVPARGRTRKSSTLLHPSPPPDHTARRVDVDVAVARTEKDEQERDDDDNDDEEEEGKEEKEKEEEQKSHSLRSPRHRSKTPLRIPSSTTSQPAPTPLRIRFPRRRCPSVLHSCFSSDEEEEDEVHGEDGMARDSASASDADADADAWSVSSDASTNASVSASMTGVHNEVILARTGMVARAQRVRVGVKVSGGAGRRL